MATSEEVRRHNLSRLLRLLHVEGAASRSGLGASTGLNRSTVGALASALAEVGLVQESAPAGHGGMGRPSIQVEPCASTHVLAVEIGVERLTAARIGLGGVVLAAVQLPQRAGDDEPATTSRGCSGCSTGWSRARRRATCASGSASRSAAWSARRTAPCDAPRTWTGSTSRCATCCSRTCRPGGPWSSATRPTSGCAPSTCAGRARACATWSTCPARSGWAAASCSGQPLTGAGGYAGELGHVVVNPAGRPCPCGRTGCWETEIGEQAILRAAGQPASAGRRGVLDACASDDPQVRAGLDRVGRWLGLGVANLVNLLNPEVVVFGGLTGDIFPVVEPVVRAALDEALVAPRADVRLELPALGADSNLCGAGELAFAPLLEDPLRVLAEVCEGG